MSVRETADAVADEARREYLFEVINAQERALHRARTVLAAVILAGGGEIVLPPGALEAVPAGTIVDAFSDDDERLHVFTQTEPPAATEPLQDVPVEEEPELRTTDPALIVEGLEAGIVYFRRGERGALERLPLAEFTETFPGLDLTSAPSLSGDVELVEPPGRGPAARI